MATSKTLAPTNVTIQIPEFTDAPDQRVNSNCIDKEADAINTLNSRFSYIMPVSYDGKAPVYISGGEYVLILGGSLSAGVYRASQGISAGTTLTSSNVTVSEYGNLANDVNRRFELLANRVTTVTVPAGGSVSLPSTNAHQIVLLMGFEGGQGCKAILVRKFVSSIDSVKNLLTMDNYSGTLSFSVASNKIKITSSNSQASSTFAVFNGVGAG